MKYLCIFYIRVNDQDRQGIIISYTHNKEFWKNFSSRTYDQLDTPGLANGLKDAARVTSIFFVYRPIPIPQPLYIQTYKAVIK